MASSFQGFIAILGGHPLRHHCLKTKILWRFPNTTPVSTPVLDGTLRGRGRRKGIQGGVVSTTSRFDWTGGIAALILS